MTRPTSLLCAIVLALLLTSCASTRTDMKSMAEQRIGVAQFVGNAASLIETQGEACFDALRKKGGPWYQGDRYVFVWRIDGWRVVYPPDPQGENKNVANLKDAGGKPIGRWFIEVAKSKEGAGWVYYEWPHPGEIFPALKLSYIQATTAPSGTKYLVGSGEYMSEPDLELARDMVDRAADLLHAEGAKAFPAFRDPAGPFVFGDAYIFVYDNEATNLFNYATPSIEGKNLHDYKDPTGFYLIREFLRRTEGGKTAVVSYAWPKPGTSALSRKTAYVRRVETPDGEMLVGAGIYAE